MTENSHVPDQDDGGAPEARAGTSLFHAAWLRKGLLLLGLVTGLVVAGLYYAQATPLYESKAQVLVVKKRPDVVTGVDTRQSAVEDYVSTHQKLIESQLIIRRAIAKYDLPTLKSFAGEKDDLAEVIAKALTVSRGRGAGGNNNILDVAFRAKDGADAAVVVDAVIESYRDFLDETYRDQSDDALKLITEARDLLQKDLAQKSKDYEEFRLQAPLLGKGREGNNLSQDDLIRIKSDRTAVRVRKEKLQGDLDAIEKARADKLPREVLLATVSDLTGRMNQENARQLPSLTLQDQLSPLLQEEQSLLARYGPNHPEVRSVRKRIEVARELFASPSAPWRQAPADDSDPKEGRPAADPVEAHVQHLRQQLNRLEIQEKRLEDLYRREFEDVRKVTTYEIRDERLRADLARTEQLCDGTIKRLEGARLVKVVGGFDARTIASPALGKKVAPKGILVFAIGALLGLLLGFGLAYVAEATDKSFRTPEEIRRRLGLPVVGCIPRLEPDTEAVRRAAASGLTLDPILCTYHRPESMEAEAYRGVRTALFFNNQGHQVIQVTSPNSGDGKSSLAANLAVSIAQSGKRTLLIDADMRKPRVHKIFGLSAGAGLAALVAGEGEPADVIQESCVPGLSILPSGPPPSNPSELLTSPRFEDLLKYLREQYDFVIVDTPPLLAVTDPSVVASRVDGVLLTVRMTKDGRPPAERAGEILRTLGARVVGVVVNAMDRRARDQAYAYGAYGYRYEREHDEGARQPHAAAAASNGEAEVTRE